jgi:hypothetical protein
MYFIGSIIAIILAQFIVWTIIPLLIAMSDGETLKEFYRNELNNADFYKVWASLTVIGVVAGFVLSWFFVISIVLITLCIYVSFKLEKVELFKTLGKFLRNV